MRVHFYGVRGTRPCAGTKFAAYGGETSCIGVEEEGSRLLLDAGTGLLQTLGWCGKEEPIHLLISHFHLDHIQGLLTFPPLFQAGRRVIIHGWNRETGSVTKQLERLFSPPLWPVSMKELPCQLEFCPLSEENIRIGEFQVETMQGNHPGGCVAFRISSKGKSLVYCTDFEHGGEYSDRLAHFAKNTDLLIYDGMYSNEEYEVYKGFGHSTREEGVRMLKLCGAGQLKLFHHAPWAEDEVLDEAEKKLNGSGRILAYEGEEVVV